MAEILKEDEEHENVYRHLKVVLGETKEVFEKLLEFYLGTIPETYEEFIEKNAHDIYHFCYPEQCCQCQCQSCHKKCPQCTCRPIRTTRRRILYPEQLDILFDRSGTKIPGHNQTYRPACNNCCCPANPDLNIGDLDVTLARFLLVNFTTIVQPGTQERKALDDLVAMRNNFAHAAKTRMSNQDYQKCQQNTTKQLLILAKVYGNEQETKDRLVAINHEPFNPKVCLQLFNTLLMQAKFDQEFQEAVNKLTEIVQELKTLKTDQMIPEFIKKDLEDKMIVEGHDVCFEIWLKETNIQVKWYKNNKEIMTGDKMSLITKGSIHKLRISRCCEDDKGIYTVKVYDTERQAKLDVKEFYTRNLKDIHCIEGNNVTFDCEVLDSSSDMKVQWYKDGVVYHSKGKQSTAMDKKRQILDIPCVEVNDSGRYEIDIDNRRRSAELTVEHYYTRSLQNDNCTEGEDVSLDCEVLYSDMVAQWYKDDIKIKNTSKLYITTDQKRHILRIPCVEVYDSGRYKIDIENRKRSADLRVESYFTKDFEQDTNCLVVGEPVTFVCEVLDYNTTAQWFLNDNELASSPRIELQTTGRQHKLSINNVVVNDSGEYTIIVNSRKRKTKLQVKDTKIIRHTIQTKTETRYYIRVMIVGKNGVGKSCLLRRLHDEEIEKVESTDGIDISLRSCKVRLSDHGDREWIFKEDKDPKREYAMRIQRVRREENVDYDDDKAISTNSQKIILEKSEHERRDVMSQIEQVKNAESNMSPTAKAKHAELNMPLTAEVKRAESNMSLTAEAEDAESSMSLTAETKHSKSSMSLTTKDNPSFQSSKTLESEQNPEFLHDIDFRKEQQTPPERGKNKRILTKNVAKEIDDFLLQIEEYEAEKNEVCVEIRFWDFAGEKDYYATHHIFLDPNAVYLLVSDCSQDIKQANPRETYDSIGEYIDFWFDTIHNCAVVKEETTDIKEETTTKQFDPPIIAVCTGRDKLEKEKVETKKDEYRRMLCHTIQDEKKSNHLRDICFVSNTKPLATDFSDLRNLILKHGEKLQSFGEVLPLKWIRLEQSLDVLRKAKIPFVSRNEIIDLSVQCYFDAEEREMEVERFLNHQHKIGNIMYYSDIENFVILDQKWLADLLKCLVSAKISTDIILSNGWGRLEKTGILEKELISALFKTNEDLKNETDQDNLVKILNKFGIIGINYDEDQYYMPYKIASTLSPSLSTIIETFGVPTQKQKSPWLCLEFNFFPLAYFTHVMLHFIENYTMCDDEIRKQKSIYHGVGVFLIDKNQVKDKPNKFIVLFCKNTIAMQVWHWDPVPKTRYNDILGEIMTVIQQVKTKYKATTLEYSVKFKCSEGDINSPSNRVSLKDLPDEKYFCGDHKTYHPSSEVYDTWFSEYPDKAEDMCPEECTDTEVKRHTYLNDIQTKTETRYYIRGMIVGKNGVGKSSLLRRLLDEGIEGVESTDGIDISIHKCKFRLSDRKWIFNADQDPKREYAMRIKHARKEENIDYKNDKTTNSQKNFLEKREHKRDDFMSQIHQAEHTESSISLTAEDNPSGQLSKDLESEKNPEFWHDNYMKEQQKPTERVKLKRKLQTLLTEKVGKEIDDFLLHIEEYEEENEVCVEIRFWDFAGEKHYYGTHHIFLDPNAVYLLVSDCSEDLNQAEPCETYDSIGEYIDFWFDTIHNCADVKEETTTKQFDPPIIAVCTGRDKLTGKVKKKEDIYREMLSDTIQGENKRNHLRDICFVSNTRPSDADFSHLRNLIFEHGKMLQSFGEVLPLKWIRLEQSLDVLRQSGIHFVSRNDIINLSVKCDFHSEEREKEVENFLNHQHKIGNIMYYSDIEDFVILSQQWLADAFKCLVSDKIDSNITLSDEWRKLEKTGILEKSLISKLFEKNPDLSDETIQENVITVLNKFGIIGIKFEEGHNLYYMPYMITSTYSPPLSKITKTFGALKEEQKSPWLCLEFDFLPLAYFTHVMLHFIGNYTMCFDKKLRKQSIYLGVGVFFVDQKQVNKLILLFCKNTIAIQIWHFRDPVPKTRYNDILLEIVTVVDQLKNKYKARNLRYSVKLKCSEGDINSPIGRVSHKYLQDKTEYVCEDHDSPTYHDSIQLFNTWFYNYSDKAEDICPEECTGLSEDAMRTVPSDPELLRLSKQFDRTDLHDLAVHLGISESEWEDVIDNHPRNIEWVKFLVLNRWKETQSGTYEDIFEALMEMKIDTHLLCQVRRIKTIKQGKGIPEEYTELIPTDELLDDFAPKVGIASFKLGIELGLGVTELETIQYNHKSDLVKQTREILQKWRNDLSIKAAFGVLQQALVNAGKGPLCLAKNIREFVEQKKEFSQHD